MAGMSPAALAAGAPDVQNSDLHTGSTSCGAIIQGKIDEYAAIISFIKLLAQGDEDAISTVQRAIHDALSGEALDERLDRALTEQRNALSAYRQLLENNNVPNADVVALRQFGVFGNEEYAPGKRLEDIPGFNQARERLLNANRDVHDVQSDIATEDWEAWKQGWKDWFDQIKSLIDDRRFIDAACFILAEGMFVIAEEVVAWGVTAISAAVVGAGAVAVRIVVSVAQQSGRAVARVGVRAVRATGNRAAASAALDRSNTIPFDRPIYPDELPEYNSIKDEANLGGKQSQNDTDVDTTSNAETSETTTVDGDGQDPDTPEPSPARRLDKLEDIECFNLPPNGNRDEMLAQLREQQDALNSMPASLLVRRRQAIAAAGGTSAIRNPKAQQAVADTFRRSLTRELRDEGFDEDEIAEIVKERMDKLAALHRLDIVAGGDPEDVSRMGDRQINSSIGPQWTKGSRIGTLETYARDAVANGRGGDLMNVELRMC